MSTGSLSGTTNALVKGAPAHYQVYIDPIDGLVHALDTRLGLASRVGATTDVVLSALITSLGSTTATIALSDQAHSIASNTTVPSNIGLHLPKGTLLSIASGVTLLHLGPSDFPLSQCFVATGKNDGTTGSGSVSFAGGSVSTAYADWWGYTGVDDSASIHNAANSGVSAVGYLGKTYVLKSIMAPNADYLQNALVGLPNTPCRHFSLAGFTTIKLADHFLDQATDATSNAHMFGNAGTCAGAHFEGITFDGNGQNNLNPAGKTRNAMAIRLVNGSDFAAEGCTFKNFAGHNVIVLNLNNPGVNQDARIVNNIFQNGGHNVGNGVENVNNTDFSFVYSYWDYTQFEGNKVRQDNVDIALKSFCGGVELHGSYSYATHNTFVGCDPAVYSVGNTNPTTDVHVDDNTILQCRRGVVLGQQNNVYQRVSASRNFISLYTSSITPTGGAGFCRGIQQTGGVGTTTTFNSTNSNAGPITDLEVNDNTIVSLVPVPTGGLSVRAMELHSINRGTVSGNRSYGMAATSYFLDGSPWGMADVEYLDNTGRDGGADTVNSAEQSVYYLNWTGQVATTPNVECWVKNVLIDGVVAENTVAETFDATGAVTAVSQTGNLQQAIYAPGLATAILTNVTIRNVKSRNIELLYNGGTGTFDNQNPGIHFAPEHVVVTAYPITEQRQWYGNETIEVVGTGQRYACTQLGWTGTTPTGTATTTTTSKTVTVSSSVGLRPGMDISIAGAGASGATLFTYIRQVVDTTHIILDAQPLTAQSGGAFSIVKATFNMVTNLGNSPSFSVWIDPATGLVHGIDNHTGLDKRSGGSSFVYTTTDQVVNNILAAVGSNPASISFSADTHVFAANTTIQNNVGIHLVAGALLSPNTGITLTLNGPCDVPRTQFVGGAGTVAFAKGVLPHGMYPEHFGGKPDWNGTTGTDNRAAIDKMLATHYGHYRLSSGNYAIKTADGNGNGITLPSIADDFAGASYGLTTITLLCAATWGVKSTAAQQRQRNFQVQVGPGGSTTYGVGISTASVGSAESCAFSDILTGTNGGGTLTNGFAVGPDNPGSSTMDIAGTTFDRCRSNGAANASFLVGNGTAGNILATTMTGCEGNESQYIVYGAKSPFTWRDGNGSQGGQTADFGITGQGSQVIVIDGHRSETSSRLFKTDGVINGALNTTISNTTFNAQSMNADGQWIIYDGGGILKLDNVSCYKQPTGTTPVIVVQPNTVTPITVIANGVSQAAPITSAFSLRTGGLCDVVAAGYNQLDTTGAVVVDAVGLAKITSLGMVVSPAGTYPITNNTTFTQGFNIPSGSRLQPASGVTATLNGPLDAGPYQIFDLSAGGTVQLGPGSVHHVYLEWWSGSLARSTPTACPDASTALTAALASVPAGSALVVHLLPGYYAMNGLVNQSFVLFVGPGRMLNNGVSNPPSAIVPFVHTSPALQVANGTQQVVDVGIVGVTLLATAADGGTGVTGLVVGGGCKRSRFDVASFGFTGDCILVEGDATYGTYDNRFYDPKVQPGAGGNGVRVVWGGAAGCTDTTLVTPMLEGAASGSGFPLVVDGCTVKALGGYVQSNLTGGAGVKFTKTATSGAQSPFLLNFGMDIDSNSSTDVLVTLDSTCPATWFDVADPMPGLYNCDGVMLLSDGVTQTAHIGQIAAVPTASQLVNPRLIGTMTLENPTTGTQYADTNLSTDSAGSLNLAAHGSIALSPLSDIVRFNAQAGNNTIETDYVSNSVTNKIKANNGLLSLLPGTALALGNPAPATTATTGFPYLPVMAGAPTGVPTAETGYSPIVFDSTNLKLWVYTGSAWKGVVLS